jgi:hypothetical protein
VTIASRDRGTLAAEGASVPPPTGRLILGVGVFALGWIATLAAASLVTASSLNSSIAGIVVFVGPKLGVLAAVAIMGKPGFAYVKSKVFGYLKPPAEVSPARHRVGIVMFGAAILFGFMEPYAGLFLPDATPSLRFSLGIDLLLLASILVLGGDFWDKIRARFVHEAKAQFPAER